MRKILRLERTYLKPKTLIMGILNVTPDSFSDGGQYTQLERAVVHAVQMVQDGADIIDIGGESTRPGASKVALEEEIARVIPVIQAVRKALPNTVISVDTYKSEVAKLALEAGADWINDIWGCRKDPMMAKVAAQAKCPLIIMHNRIEKDYHKFWKEFQLDLQESIQIAIRAGVPFENIILDPGIGFSKNIEQNLFLMNHLDDLVRWGYPVLLGTSRKRFIQHTLQTTHDEVIEGTIATVIFGILQGCQIMRVHDVKAIKKACLMSDAMLEKEHDHG